MNPPTRSNMPLADDIETLGERHGVLVIGSGYGGAITAARLAKAGHAVTILERGREWKTGSLPQEEDEFVQEFKPLSGNPLSLFEYVTGDVDVLVGNGLGGTSLINAGVVLRPDDEIFKSAHWPEAIRKASVSGELAGLFSTVEETLEVVTAGVGLPKTEIHRQSAIRRSRGFDQLRIAVNLDRYDGTENRAGVVQHKCIGCGNCVTGCNVGAKNTLAMNYLPMAKRAGARIFTQVEVDFVAPAREGGWAVFARVRSMDAAPTEVVLHARAVVLSAGTLGTTGILLRSREQGLALPAKLGTAFSSNGDLSGFAYNTPWRADSAGFDFREPPDYKVGPSITAMIYPEDVPVHERFIVEDGALPKALVNLFRRHIPWFGVVTGKHVDQDVMAGVNALARTMRDQLGDDPRGAVNHSMVYLAMGHDGAAGKVVLNPDGEARVLWGGAGEHAVFKRISEEMKALSLDLGGTYYENPRWSEIFDNVPITAHPLGGCPMGEDAGTGVVDHMGRVFRPEGGLHEELYVADGSLLPTSLGVNPLATISALSERIAMGFVAAHDARPPIKPFEGSFTAPIPRALPAGLQFTELLSGFVATSSEPALTREEFLTAERRGRDEGGAILFKATIFIDDVDEFIRSKEHEAIAEGHVESGLLGGSFVVDEGRFNLYVVDEATKNKRMVYRLHFHGLDRRQYTLHGVKEILADSGVQVWSENTTLFTTLHEGPSEQGPVIAKGVLHLSLEEFAKQLTSFRVRRCPDEARRLEVLERFGEFFFDELWDSYVRHRLFT